MTPICQNYGPLLGYVGIMEKKMETTIMGYTGVIIGFTIESKASRDLLLKG